MIKIELNSGFIPRVTEVDANIMPVELLNLMTEVASSRLEVDDANGAEFEGRLCDVSVLIGPLLNWISSFLELQAFDRMAPGFGTSVAKKRAPARKKVQKETVETGKKKPRPERQRKGVASLPNPKDVAANLRAMTPLVISLKRHDQNQKGEKPESEAEVSGEPRKRVTRSRNK